MGENPRNDKGTISVTIKKKPRFPKHDIEDQRRRRMY
jgi:hypothetical protein